MESIIGLVHEYRDASGTSEKTKIAHSIILAISGRLTLFLINRCPRETADMRQLIFVAIVRGLDGFRGESDEEFWAWCIKIARRVLSKHFQKVQSDPTILIDPDELIRLIDASGTKQAIAPDELAELNDALEVLKKSKPECLSLLWARYILGLGIGEIAAEMGVAFDAVRMKINRCLTATRSLLES